MVRKSLHKKHTYQCRKLCVPGMGQSLLHWQFGRSGVWERVRCPTDVSDLNLFHALPLQLQRDARMGLLPAVPATASPQVSAMWICHEADDEVGNHIFSVLAFLKGYVGLVTVSQRKQVWQQDKKDGKT